MYSKTHFAISAVVGAAIAVAVGTTTERAVFLVGYSALLGIGIDLDHLVIARLRAGDWRHLRFVFSNPRVAIADQDRIFEEGDVGKLPRLLGHALLGGSLVVVVATANPFLALVSGVVIYVHVVCDLLYDVWQEPVGRQRSN